MKSLLMALSFAVLLAGFAPQVAEAKRFGGGAPSGMQRSLPARTPPTAAPTQAAPTAPAAPAVPPSVAPPKRSWLGPIAGLAAGLGIAALMSHMGLGGELANIVMIALLAFVAFIAIRFVMARFARGAQSPSMATPNGMHLPPMQATAATEPSWNPVVPAAASSTPVATALPAGFDAPAFERIAKMIFIRMQAANDSADLNDLRAFTTPEMFASVKLELQERGSAAQQTDVVRVDAEVLDVTTEAERQIVSVRFHGLIREQANGATEHFDEVWHLVKPADGSREWAIAGIQQSALA